MDSSKITTLLLVASLACCAYAGSPAPTVNARRVLGDTKDIGFVNEGGAYVSASNKSGRRLRSTLADAVVECNSDLVCVVDVLTNAGVDSVTARAFGFGLNEDGSYSLVNAEGRGQNSVELTGFTQVGANETFGAAHTVVDGEG